jgi:putative glutamine amidotransferase
VQHLPDAVGSDLHCPTVGEHGRHDVTFAEASAVSGMFGKRAEVATYHHQGVAGLGRGLTATGWAEDGVVEAVELAGRRWVVGVQWHPEVFAGAALFEEFVAACAGYRAVGGA